MDPYASGPRHCTDAAATAQKHVSSKAITMWMTASTGTRVSLHTRDAMNVANKYDYPKNNPSRIFPVEEKVP